MDAIGTISYLMVAQNNAPEVSATLGGVLIEQGEQRTIDLLGYFHDPDGDDLSYTVSSSNASIHQVSVSSGVLKVVS